jgi:phage I-like protein
MRSHDPANQMTAPDVLDVLTRQRIVDGLRTALSMAQEEPPSRLEELRSLLDEVRDRVDAWELTRELSPNLVYGRRESRLALCALSTNDGEPVGEFLLIPFGEVRVERPASGSGFEFTRRHAESARNWFGRLGRKLAIDYEHQSFGRCNSRPDGLRPAAGWIGGLEVRDDGLWAVDVTWTPRARELLRSGEYRYFSPVIYWSDEDYSDVVALGPVALTNDPAMQGVRPLAASRAAPGSEVAAQQGSTSEAPALQHDPLSSGETDDPAAPEPAEEAEPRAELEAVQAEVALLRRRLREQEAEAFVAAGLRAGKITEGSRADWHEDFLCDPRRARERLARAPVLLPPGRLVTVDVRGRVARMARLDAAPRSSELEQRWGIEAEDLTAYERAVAAGRVKHVSWNGPAQ